MAGDALTRLPISMQSCWMSHSEMEAPIVLFPDAFAASRTDVIAPAAVRLHLPLINPFPHFVQVSSLAAYGVEVVGEMGKAGTHVDRILQPSKSCTYIPFPLVTAASSLRSVVPVLKAVMAVVIRCRSGPGSG
jgi:hypothetical protein